MNAQPQTDMWPTKPAESRSRVPTNAEMFRELDADLYFAHQLFKRGRGVHVLDGITNSRQRLERIRAEILAAHFTEQFTLDQRGKPTEETFAQAFLRRYGEPLQGKL